MKLLRLEMRTGRGGLKGSFSCQQRQWSVLRELYRSNICHNNLLIWLQPLGYDRDGRPTTDDSNFIIYLKLIYWNGVWIVCNNRVPVHNQLDDYISRVVYINLTVTTQTAHSINLWCEFRECIFKLNSVMVYLTESYQNVLFKLFYLHNSFTRPNNQTIIQIFFACLFRTFTLLDFIQNHSLH